MSNSDYKLASIDISKISSAARQALMAADEQYHAWPADKQEKFRATMSESSRKNIQRILLKNLLEIESTSDTIDSHLG